MAKTSSSAGRSAGRSGRSGAKSSGGARSGSRSGKSWDKMTPLEKAKNPKPGAGHLETGNASVSALGRMPTVADLRPTRKS